MTKPAAHLIEIINAYNILVRKHKGMKPLGTVTCRKEDNIKTLKEIRCKSVK
jgi:hypothetical protein